MRNNVDEQISNVNTGHNVTESAKSKITFSSSSDDGSNGDTHDSSRELINMHESAKVSTQLPNQEITEVKDENNRPHLGNHCE